MTGRVVVIPDQITRVVPYDNKTNVLLFPIVGDLMVAKARAMASPDLKYISKDFLRLREIDTKNTEEMMKLKPDLIVVGAFISKGENLSSYLAFSEKTGIPMVFADLELTSLDKTYQFLGQLFNRPEKAAVLSGFIDSVYLDVENCKTNAAVTGSAYLANDPDGLRTTPVTSSHAQLFEFMGISNVAKTGLDAKGFANVSIEQVILWNPNYIFCMGKGASSPYRNVLKSALWRNITAVKNRQVFYVPSEPYLWFDMPPSVNRILGLIWFQKIFYGRSPEQTRQTITEFYQLFYGYGLSIKEYEKLYEWQ